MSRRLFTLVPSICCLLLLVGCGYQHNGSFDGASSGQSGYKWSSLYREDISTVAIPIFANKDFRRGVEFGLTSSVIKQLEAHSPYRVAPRDRADTILEGEIVSISLSTLSRETRVAIPQEVANVTPYSPGTPETLLELVYDKLAAPSP